MSIKFNKMHYAQLRSQKLDPPPGTGFEPRETQEYIQANVGMKLACGFEMLVASDGVKTVGYLQHLSQLLLSVMI